MWKLKQLAERFTNYMMDYSVVGIKVREATNSDPWGPTCTQMKEIAWYTYEAKFLEEILDILWERIVPYKGQNDGDQWRKTTKAFIMMEYLLCNGSYKVAEECKKELLILKTMRAQRFPTIKGRVGALKVRCQRVFDLLTDTDLLQGERMKADLVRIKMDKTQYTRPNDYKGDDGSRGTTRTLATLFSRLAKRENKNQGKELTVKNQEIWRKICTKNEGAPVNGDERDVYLKLALEFGFRTDGPTESKAQPIDRDCIDLSANSNSSCSLGSISSSDDRAADVSEQEEGISSCKSSPTQSSKPKKSNNLETTNFEPRKPLMARKSLGKCKRTGVGSGSAKVNQSSSALFKVPSNASSMYSRLDNLGISKSTNKALTLKTLTSRSLSSSRSDFDIQRIQQEPEPFFCSDTVQTLFPKCGFKTGDDLLMDLDEVETLNLSIASDVRGDELLDQQPKLLIDFDNIVAGNDIETTEPVRVEDLSLVKKPSIQKLLQNEVEHLMNDLTYRKED